MPYIAQERRESICTGIKGRLIDSSDIKTVGELNFAITMFCLAWWNRSASYASINDVMGVLDCVGKEFYRRIAVPYEDRKAAESGDVFPEVRPLDNLNIHPAVRQAIAEALKNVAKNEMDSPENDPFGNDPLPPPQRPSNMEINEVAAGDDEVPF